MPEWTPSDDPTDGRIDANAEWLDDLPPGRIDPIAGWLPTTSRDQDCLICGDSDVVWLHPIHPEGRFFSVFGKQHVVNSFCCCCERCEALLSRRDDEAEAEVLSLMVAKWPPYAGDGDGSAVQLLGVFRSADLGARRFDV